MAKLTKTRTPGVFRRHVKGCDGRGRCECSYVVIWRHQGKQSTETFPSFELAREAKAKRHVVDSRPATKIAFGDYFADWIETYALAGLVADSLSQPGLSTGAPSRPMRSHGGGPGS